MVETASRAPGSIVEVLTVPSSPPVAWAYVERPAGGDDPDVERLGARFGLDPQLLSDCLGHRQTTKLIRQTGYDYLAMVSPSPINPSEREPSSPQSFSAFVGPDFLVTVHHGDARSLARLFREHQTEQEAGKATATSPIELLRAIAERFVSQGGAASDALASRVGQAERSLFFDDREWTREVITLRREATSLTQALTQQRELLGQLARDAQNEAESAGWQLLAYRTDRSIGIAGACEKALDALSDARGTLATQRACGATRLSTALVGLTLPPALGLGLLVAGRATASLSFEALLGAVVTYVVVGLFLFRRAGWL